MAKLVHRDGRITDAPDVPPGVSHVTHHEPSTDGELGREVMFTAVLLTTSHAQVLVYVEDGGAPPEAIRRAQIEAARAAVHEIEAGA